mmetsp:Transcript_34824/g.51040  ORF Transcript_34824/g.51040 Transcript_34824/m.51040 type:complete len:1874 (+) Transcript_34824:600-6221(+)
MESTFSQDMVLRNVESCNSWFSVLLSRSMTQEPEPLITGQQSTSKINSNCTTNSDKCDGNLGNFTTNLFHNSPDRKADTVDQSNRDRNGPITIRAKKLSGMTTSTSSKVSIGKAHSVITCSGRSSQYSFYSCALDWLEKRDFIQPPGCGLSEEEIIADILKNKGDGQSSKILGDILQEGASTTSRGNQEESTRQVVKNSAIIALREVVSYLSTRYDAWDAFLSHDPGQNWNSSSRATDSVIHAADEDVVNDSFPNFLGHGNSPKINPYPQFHQQSTSRIAEHRTKELISHATVQKFEAANNAWKKVCAMGMNIITGTVRAKTDYVLHGTEERADFDLERLPNEKTAQNESNQHHRQSSLTVSMPSLILQSSLDVPTLFDKSESKLHDDDIDSSGVLDFEPVHVAQVSKRYMRVRNPSGIPIQVRLSAPAFVDDIEVDSQNQLFVQTNSGDSHPWWTGGSYWVSDSESNLLQSNHNLTIKSGGGAYVSLVNPSLHSISSFVLGCGKRCGLRNEASNTAEKMYSPIGAASAEHSELMGHAQEGHGIDELGQSSYKNLKTSLPPAFALGLRSQTEIVLPPHGNGLLGPIYFRPPKRGDFEGKVYIENSLSGLEAVKFRGRGLWEKVVFLDDENPSGTSSGGDVEVRYGRPTLMFSGSAASRFSHGVVKSVVVANIGDVPADFDNVYLTTGESRYPQSPRSTSRHSKDSRNNQERHNVYIRHTECSERGYRLLGCEDDNDDEDQFLFGGGDLSIRNIFENKWMPGWLSTLFSPPKVVPYAKRNTNSNDKDASNLKHGFILQPNETKTLYIEHTPDCTFRSMYASLILEFRDRTDFRGRRSGGLHDINGWERSFQNQRLELLLGYDMGQKDAHVCVPLAPSLMSKFFRFASHSKFSHSDEESKSINYDDPDISERDLAIFLSVCFFLTLAWMSSNVIRNIMRRNTASIWFHSTLSPIDSDKGEKKTANSMLRFIWRFIGAMKGNRARLHLGNIHGFSWNATFRCLARADPSSLDLTALGKEQTRQVLFGKYKKLNILPTQCLLANGTFARDTMGVNKGGNENGSSTGGGETEVRNTSAHHNRRSSAGSQQVLTLSDAMFNMHVIQNEGFRNNGLDSDGCVDLFLPCGLGWRAAANQGIIAPFDVGNASHTVQGGSSHVKELLSKRGFFQKKTQEFQQCNEKPNTGLPCENSRSDIPPLKTANVINAPQKGNVSTKKRDNISKESDNNEYQKTLASSKSTTQASGESISASGDLAHVKVNISTDNDCLKSKGEFLSSKDHVNAPLRQTIKSPTNELSAHALGNFPNRNTTKTTGEIAKFNRDSKKATKYKGEKQQSKKHISRVSDSRGDGTSSQKRSNLSRCENSLGASSATPDEMQKNTKGKILSRGKGGSAVQLDDDGDLPKDGEAFNDRGRRRKDELQKTSQGSGSGSASIARDAQPTKRSKKQRKKKVADESAIIEKDISKKPSRQRLKQRSESQPTSGQRQRTTSPQSSSSSITTQSTSESGNVQFSMPGSPLSVSNNTPNWKSRNKLVVTAKVNPPPFLSQELPSLPNGQTHIYGEYGLQTDQLGTGPGKLRPPPGLAPPPGFAAEQSNNDSWGNFGSVSSSNVPRLHPQAAQAVQAAPNTTFALDTDYVETIPTLSSEDVLSSTLLSLEPNYLSSNNSSSPINELQGAGLLASILSEQIPHSQSAVGSNAQSVNVIAGTELRALSSPQNITVGNTAGDLLVSPAEFDVNKYLDAILNDSHVEGEGNEAENNGGTMIGSASQTISQGTQFRSNLTTISSDPWSRSGVTSHAPSYDLAVGGSTGTRPLGVISSREDPIGQLHHHSSIENTENSSLYNMPLLTPAIILSSNEDENNENVDAYFGAESSFYADLLG